MVKTGEVSVTIKVADECWIGLALLHRKHPDRTSFPASEISARIGQEHIHPTRRAGIPAHIYQHNVANVEPDSGRYRMFYRLPDGTLRLFRPGDQSHPSRRGKTKPDLEDLPAEYRDLLDWYEQEYCAGSGQVDPDADPLLKLRGVGERVWRNLGGGDAFVSRERAGWDSPSELPEASQPGPLAEQIWQRIVHHQNEEFRTVKGLPFTYEIEGRTGIWFYREGKRINRRLSRAEVIQALKRSPLRKVTDIRDLQDPSYLYGLLTDERIHGSDY